MSETSARFPLPLLVPGQAQKEMTHNEALALIDILLNPVVEAVNETTPPIAPTPGQCWVIGVAPTGTWSGRDLMIAGWTDGGWRFAPCPEGVSVWSKADQLPVRKTASGWETGVLKVIELRVGANKVVGARQPSISAPSGGSVTDAEARIAINSILSALQTHGLIAV